MTCKKKRSVESSGNLTSLESIASALVMIIQVFKILKSILAKNRSMEISM